MSRLFPDPPRPAWSLSLCSAAGEAGGSFQSARREPVVYVPPGSSADPERSRGEAARRAKSKARRFVVANGLNRLGTLTYAGAGCFDLEEVAADVGGFFRRMRERLGGAALPYLWVREWHPKGHGLHVHFGVNRYVRRSLIEDAWGRGFVHIKTLTDLPIGSASRAESRKVAGYLGKYIAKTFEDSLGGVHRYEVAQGFTPEVVRFAGSSMESVLRQAVERMGAPPQHRWSSADREGWDRPPAVWFQWA